MEKLKKLLTIIFQNFHEKAEGSAGGTKEPVYFDKFQRFILTNLRGAIREYPKYIIHDNLKFVTILKNVKCRPGQKTPAPAKKTPAPASKTPARPKKRPGRRHLNDHDSLSPLFFSFLFPFFSFLFPSLWPSPYRETTRPDLGRSRGHMLAHYVFDQMSPFCNRIARYVTKGHALLTKYHRRVSRTLCRMSLNLTLI